MKFFSYVNQAVSLTNVKKLDYTDSFVRITYRNGDDAVIHALLKNKPDETKILFKAILKELNKE